ncbi:MAG: mannose-1-phosphate guanylyltransferase/mannose-6-phosphate isomerase [Epsilonproteobacteria bacterium]|nr:mannose-1-phosphate guanylyltransferase/mannose-6-phosphate isomerase [Campylobacterota bacterium]
MTNIILCGGSGTRLWPISRTNLPKQFLQMFNGESLFQKTCKNNAQYCQNTLLISNAEQYFIAIDQYSSIKDQLSNTNLSSIIEPVGRNTAGAIGLASLYCDPNEILFVTPSDHLIENDINYEMMIKRGTELAKEGFLVTFGIEPTSPHTGYGYIEPNGEDVKLFHEKPSYEDAQRYIENGFLWNSGMFCFQAKTYLEQLKKHASHIYEAVIEAFNNTTKEQHMRIKTEDMIQIPEDSIDYAVLEKSSEVKVVKAHIKWNDIGSFDALDTVFEKDENNNTKIDNLITLESNNNFIFGKYKTIALSHVNDLIVVETPTALLISKKGKSQSIKELVKLVKQKEPSLVQFGRTVYRPWGKYTNLENADKFKVKILRVEPGKRLSLQKHLHRSEHWTVVEGTAFVEIDEKSQLLRPNESTYIPIGAIHRLSNKGKIPLKIIEVQVGEYLEEDDIIRYEDDYRRT